jgi:hypothetical protein
MAFGLRSFVAAVHRSSAIKMSFRSTLRPFLPVALAGLWLGATSSSGCFPLRSVPSSDGGSATEDGGADGAGSGSGGRGATGTGGGAPGTGGSVTGTGGGATGTGGGAQGSGGATGTGGGAPGTGGSVTGTGGGATGTGGSAQGSGGATGSGGVPGCITSVSGTVYDPAGKLPIFNATVYVPTTPLDPFPPNVICDRCSGSVSGSPVATTVTDPGGRFRLEGVPPGNNVRLVIQVGRWRREVTIPAVTACTDTPIAGADLTRLPRTQAEGNIPRIAVTTGGADALECLIRRFGVADSEFTTDGGTGRVHLYAGGKGTDSFAAGGPFAAATALWSSPSKLASYDMILLSCEGSTSQFLAQKPQTSVDNVAAYVNAGGRLFLSHLHYFWLQQSPAFSGTGTYAGGLSPPDEGAIATVSQTFPRGVVLAQWLAGPMVNASTAPGQLALYGSEHSVTAVTPPTTEWIYIPSPRASQALSFNAPVGMPEANQCGRVLFADIHVKAGVSTTGGFTGGDDSDPEKPFPTGCQNNETSPQAKAMEFLLFDLVSCL